MPRNYDKMHERHGNPRMRPSVDKLISKLRTLTPLQDEPTVTLEVIHDMMHHYFVKQQQRPWELWRLVNFGMLELQMVLGKPLESVDFVNEDLGPDAAEGALTSGGAPEVGIEPQISKQEEITQFLKLSQNKDGVEKLLRQHKSNFYADYRVRCGCDRFFDDEHEWSRHVRIRIWRYLLNEFKPDSEEVPSEGS